uniref:SH2 domain-containing protein n=1 Tax=Biomphalaria glabrata TaxID=6526 RepID=A0A2C9L9Q8_BIOGL
MPPSGSRRPPPPPPGASVPSGLPSSMKDSGQPPPLPRRPTQGKSKDEPEETSDDEYLQPVVQAQDLYEPMTAPNPVNTSVQRKQGLALPPPNDIISTLEEPKKDDDYVIPDGVQKEYHNPDEAPPPLPGRPPVKRDIPPPLVNVKPVSEGLPSPKEHKAILPPKTPKPEPPKKPSNSNVKKPDGPQLPPRVVQPPPSENKRDSRSDDNSSAGSTSSGSVSMQQDTAHSNGGSDLRNQSKVRVLPTIPLKHGINKQQEIKNPVTLPSEEIYDDAVSEDLGCYPWFHPNINRQEGDRRVTQLNKNGSYLVRTSSKENHPYTLVVYFDGTTINLPLRKRDDNRFAIGQFKKDEVHFASVPQLITHHTTNNIKLTRGGSVMLTNTPPKR